MGIKYVLPLMYYIASVISHQDIDGPGHRTLEESSPSYEDVDGPCHGKMEARSPTYEDVTVHATAHWRPAHL